MIVRKSDQSPRVCVIGAGVAGMSVARYLQDEGIRPTVLEATRYVGGTWRFDPRVGRDEDGQPLYTSMYRHLRTNLPKPTMEIGGYPLGDDLPSFPTWKQYLEYLKSYAKHFNLYQHIKFLSPVISIRREHDVWKVKYKHIPSGQINEEDYDYVVVGNGHFSKPNLPNITGEDIFKGTITHSHDYKEPDPYIGRRVLVVGGGPSGVDIGLDVSEVSRTLIHSHHLPFDFKTPYPSHYKKKPDVKRFTENGVEFVDGTFEEIDDVIYCTGFRFNYPFLDDSSELVMEHRSVGPLHQHIVNIRQPTMMFVGLVVRACLVVAIDAQARYAAALINGNFTLPPEEDMMKEWRRKTEALSSRGLRPHLIHLLADKEDEYYEELTRESGIARVPPVLYKIRVAGTKLMIQNFRTFRNYKFEVLDSHNFAVSLEEPSKSTHVSFTPAIEKLSIA